MNALQLYLASASPRRRELLQGIGLAPRVMPTDLDERRRPGETARSQVRRLAEAKARHAGGRLRPADPAGIVLAADTVVVLDGECLGKPADPGEARSMLQRLSGRGHEVLTGVFLTRTDDGRSAWGVECTRVYFRPYDDRSVAAYVATGESLDKAGGYGIQGRGSLLCERIEGSWSNVVGLPLERLPGWMESIGIDLWDLLPTPR
jgi:septum formation protein